TVQFNDEGVIIKAQAQSRRQRSGRQRSIRESRSLGEFPWRSHHNALERTAPLLRIGGRGPRRSASSRSAFRGRAAGRRHLMMHVVMVVMVVPPVVVVMMMMRLLHGRGRSGRSGFLRPGV